MKTPLSVEISVKDIPEVAAALTRLETSEALLYRIVRYGDHKLKPENGDWACAECKPHSDMLVEGFRCIYHAFWAWYAERESAPPPPLRVELITDPQAIRAALEDVVEP